VVGEPGLIGQAEPSGEQEAVGVGKRDGCAEQRMVGGGQPQVGGIRQGGRRRDPVAAPLERVCRQADGGPVVGLEDSRPRDADAVRVRLGERQQETLLAALIPAQRREYLALSCRRCGCR
jgi:hypothetical protein